MENNKEITLPVNWGCESELIYFKPFKKIWKILGFTKYSILKILEEPIKVEEGWTYKVEIISTAIYWLHFKIKTYEKQ